MTRFTEAVYTHGVLKPTSDLDLREGQCVQIIVESIDEQRSDRSLRSPG